MHGRRIFIIVGAVLITVVAGVGGLVLAKTIDESRKSSNNQHPVDNQPVKPVKTALSCVEALPVATQIGQKLMAAGYSDQLASSQPSFLQNEIGGIILMDEASAESVAAFRQGFKIAPTVAVDQEGGTVQRYKSEGILPGATEMAADFTTADAYQKYVADANYLKGIGITVNFAPVVDVLSATPSPLPDRMYSSDPSTVTQYATQAIKASQQAGITPVIKHFPGLGSASGNTDNGSATTAPFSQLENRDVFPYQQLAQLKPDAMVSNAIVPGLTDGQPAIWSAVAVNTLRGYGYQNSVIYTDSLTADAIPGTIEDAAVKAWLAGNDVAVIVQDRKDTATLAATFQAVLVRATTALQNKELDAGQLSQSVLRILERKNVDPCSL